jgi:hypothetical protein
MDNASEPETRRPHLVTLEDPIEEYYARYPGTKTPVPPTHLAQWGLDYTPRQIGRQKDTASLADGLRDALRQTPSVVYIGEVRDPREWEEILKFAGTGHLVVATAHAGSLVESMAKIFEGTGTRNAAQRAQIAERILGLIHIRSGEVRLQRNPAGEVLLPAVWRRSPKGISNLVTDGLSSITPNNPNDSGSAGCSSFGRLWFARNLKPRNSKVCGGMGYCAGCTDRGRGCRLTIGDRVERLAIEWDLEGI